MKPVSPAVGKQRPAAPPGLPATLAVLAFVVGIAALGLALDRNWLKLARVLLAAGAYAGVLVTAFRRLASRARVHWRPFAVAGGVAGGVSGVVRPGIDVRLLLASIKGAALLLGSAHWLALRWWQRFVRREDF